MILGPDSMNEGYMPESYSVILTTVATREEARSLSEMLVTRKLAACVQVVEITSTYVWEGRLNQGPEFLLLIKTASRRYKDVEAAVVQNHSYEMPELLELPVGRGLPGYLGWISVSTQAP